MVTRALVLAVATLAGCAPAIDYGTYLCGVEQRCPEGQACNGTDNRCVRPDDVEPFACDPQAQREPDNTAAEAFELPAMACVSIPTVLDGCLAEGEGEDWFKVVVPMGCTAVVTRIRITYPLAWQEVKVELGDAGGTILEGEGECDASETALDDLGFLDKCIKRTVTPGETFTIRVWSDGALSCGGACAFNRYSLSVRLETPST